ncbi:MAG: hypothetical protein DMG82_03705 [Acidobacteria bacterium]|nr:MAG: hypothetical protein DMG82_03705 [Acidobacteriota bacterium]
MEPAAEAALSHGRANGGTTILNPAPVRALPASVLQLVDVLTPNQTEAKVLTGRDPDDRSDIWHQIDLLGSVLDQLPGLVSFSSTGHRAIREIDKRRNPHPASPENLRSPLYPCRRNHRGLKVILQAFRNVLLPARARKSVRNDRGLNPARQARCLRLQNAGIVLRVAHREPHFLFIGSLVSSHSGGRRLRC